MESLSPKTAWAVPMSLGPRGAQYSPVLDMSSFPTHSIRDFAASSGTTAETKKS